MTDTKSKDVNNFNKCLMSMLGGKYDQNMRRAVQSAVLFQAGDDVDRQYSNLKIFQRKLMLFEAATQIISSLEEIPADDRNKLFYRTCTGKLVLSPELAWRRLMYTKRETERLVEEVNLNEEYKDKTHAKICEELAQKAYNKKYNNSKSQCPRGWDLSHMKEFIIYRMFYNRCSLLQFSSVASVNLEYNPNTVLLYTQQLHDDEFEQREAQYTAEANSSAVDPGEVILLQNKLQSKNLNSKGDNRHIQKSTSSASAPHKLVEKTSDASHATDQSLSSPQPPAQSSSSIQPPAQSLSSPQPPAQSLTSTQHPAQSLIPIQHPAQSLTSTEPLAQSLSTPQPTTTQNIKVYESNTSSLQRKMPFASDASSLTAPHIVETPDTRQTPSNTIVHVENTSLEPMADDNNDTELRTKIVQEIKEQLELLKEFEGVISAEEMKMKKKELFLSLPIIPSSLGKRKEPTDDDCSVDVKREE